MTTSSDRRRGERSSPARAGDYDRPAAPRGARRDRDHGRRDDPPRGPGRPARAAACTGGSSSRSRSRRSARSRSRAPDRPARPAPRPRGLDRLLRRGARPRRHGAHHVHPGRRAIRAGDRRGGMYTVSLGTVAKTYPTDIRPRVMALLASMWILPGCSGRRSAPSWPRPSAGAGRSWFPCRPIVLAAVLVMPVAPRRAGERGRSSLPIAPSLVLMVGAGALLAGLTELSVWSVPLVLIGLAVTIQALRRITPPGTLVARRGCRPPRPRRSSHPRRSSRSTGSSRSCSRRPAGCRWVIAGIVLTFSALAWAAGSWWQSRVSARLGTRG